MASGTDRLERPHRLLQETRAAACVAEGDREARAFLDHERCLPARTRLGDEARGAPEALLDGLARRSAIESAENARPDPIRARLPGARADVLRQPDRPLDRGPGRLAVAESELRLGQ